MEEGAWVLLVRPLSCRLLALLLVAAICLKCRGGYGSAAGAGECHVDFFLSQILGLEEGDSFVERSIADAGILEDFGVLAIRLPVQEEV